MTKCIVKYDLDVGSNPEIESFQELKLTFVRIDILFFFSTYWQLLKYGAPRYSSVFYTHYA
jgi:hypothetical protein